MEMVAQTINLLNGHDVDASSVPAGEIQTHVQLGLNPGLINASGYSWTADYVTVTGDLSGGGSDLTGIAFGLGAAVFYAAVILLNKFIKNVEGIHRTFLQFLAAIVVLLPYVLLTGGFHLGSLDGLGWGCLLVVGLVHTGVTYCLYFSSLKELPGQKAAILSYLDPLVAVLVSVLVLGEQMTALQAVGGLLILGFTLWNEVAPQKQR